jgi:gliding motility-associated-like protein
MKVINILFFLLFNFISISQINFYQDIFQGGVTGNGYNSGFSNELGTISINIENGSTIRKAFLYTTIYQSPPNATAYLNGNEIILSPTNSSLSEYISISSGSVFKMKTQVTDVTNFIEPDINLYTLIPPQNQSINIYVDGGYLSYYLIVFYENPTLSLICTSVIFNDRNSYYTVNYPINNLNPIDLANNVAFTLNASEICNTFNDGSYVRINNQLLGLIGGQEDNTNWSCTGSKGSFYYQNNTTYGIGNDVANTTMDGPDVLANIESYLTSTTSFNATFDYQQGFSGSYRTNPIHQLFLAYTTTCDTFSVSVSNDTIVCLGETVQLFATGGNSTGTLPAYEWFPTTGLSCSTCPNPIFTADSNMYYTVRIRNNDSCSVVRPVKINVRPRPLLGAITTTPSECGACTGSVSVSVASGTASPVSFTLNDTLTQSSGLFSNLAAGNYTLSFVDGNGCVSLDTLVTVSEVNSTVAQFIVSPSYGTAPLQVNLNNTSQNATNFLWSVNGTSLGAVLESYTCDPSGIYTIELIAWQYDPSCADTFSLSVTAVDRLIVPTAFTPDGDGVNDFWELPNIDVIYPENSVVVFNRWGSVVYESEKGKYALNPWKGDYKGKPLPVGTYYFIIRVDENEEHDLKGSVTVVK